MLRADIYFNTATCVTASSSITGVYAFVSSHVRYYIEMFFFIGVLICHTLSPCWCMAIQYFFENAEVV
ncbi:hypothetical protein A988_07209 [Pseudomonas syringae BRIP39023]|nr:hypothetical protein A988_07209 [Pseudomonas syringae BRIP39023]